MKKLFILVCLFLPISAFASLNSECRFTKSYEIYDGKMVVDVDICFHTLESLVYLTHKPEPICMFAKIQAFRFRDDLTDAVTIYTPYETIEGQKKYFPCQD